MRRFSIGLVVLALVTAGCSSQSFVGQRVGDFRAYYNTFYNAQKAFDEATRSLDTRSEPVDPGTYLSLFPGPERVTDEEALEQAIEKSADVLREHPGSKWVDDALLLIGKSYFYQGNFAGAEQKFREVIEQESKLEGEARVWLARALIRAEKHEEAGAYLRAQLEEDGADRAYRAQLDLLQGELHVRSGRWEEAVQALAEGLKETRDDRLAGRGRFLLGQVYETLERYDEAAEAYEAAADGGASYELAFAARVGAVRTLGHAGHAEKALERLQRMGRDGKNADRRAELALLRGELYRMQDRPAAARQALRVLLYGEELDPSPVRGRAHYALGVLYRDAFEDYVRAAAHFDTAATALERPAEDAEGPVTSVAVTDSRELAMAFGSLAEAVRRTERLDSLLHLSSLDEEAFEAFVADLREQRTRELQASRRAQEEHDVQQRFAAEEFDDSQQQLATEEVREGAGFLFYRDPARVQEARAAFARRWGRRPRAPNWRRLSAVSGQAGSAGRRASAQEAEVANGAQPVSPGAAPAAGGEPLVDVTAVPRDSASRATMRIERARARYELGNALFLTAGRPDSAAALYREVIAEGTDERAALQARYALGEVARARGDMAAAHEHYHRLIEEHPTSELAARARARLREEGEAPGPTREAPAQAEQEYAAAYEQWQRGRHAEALQGLVATAARYARTEVAPRALLAAGTLSLEWARRDTMALHEPLPVALPDSLLREGGLLAPQLETSADTTAFEEVPPDTMAAKEVPPDTMATAKASADTTVASGLPQADSLASDEGPPTSPRVETFFASIVAHYPNSPQADRARRVLKVLEERPPQVADTTAVVSDTSASGGPVAVPDTSALPSLAASVRDSLLGGGDLDRTRSSWTIVVGAEEEQAAADTLAGDFRKAGYRAGVLTGKDTSRYRVGVGQFAEEEDARVAFEALGEQLSPQGALHRMQATEPPDSSLYGGSIDRQEGGWTLVVVSEEEEREAEAAAAPYREAGYRVGVFSMQVEGTTRYRVGVGQFTSQEGAEGAREALAAALPGDSWLLQVPPERN